ncbi:hypothetical protein [Lysinibacillus sp. NPDC056232]|uniref:hypothetical protein n=1 Tax=Lysinibacillus sp. NPDC056232 TaxID=3345756 RepID=UPI0035DB37FE
MKAIIIKTVKSDVVQTVAIALCILAMIIGVFVAFIYIAFPKDPETEEMIKQAEIRNAEHAKWYEELKKKNGWDD